MIGILLALLGVILNIGKKIDSQQKLAKAGNVKFTLLGYFQSDWFSILSAFVVVIVVALQAPNIEAAIPEKYKAWAWLIYIAIGYMGSDLLIYALGRGRNAALSVIDRKTDILDGKVAPEEK